METPGNRKRDEWHSRHWNTEGKPDGGASYGIGFAISWQRGSLGEKGRNGAFLIEVLEACLDELIHKHDCFPCQENVQAIAHLEESLRLLNSRLDRRRQEGIQGEHKETPMPTT